MRRPALEGARKNRNSTRRPVSTHPERAASPVTSPRPPVFRSLWRRKAGRPYLILRVCESVLAVFFQLAPALPASRLATPTSLPGATPTQPSPIKGEGFLARISAVYSPSPSMGEGRVGVTHRRLAGASRRNSSKCRYIHELGACRRTASQGADAPPCPPKPRAKEDRRLRACLPKPSA